MRLYCMLAMFVLGACSFGMCEEKTHPPTFRVLVISDSTQSKLHKIDANLIKKTFKGLSETLKTPLSLKMVDSHKFSMQKFTTWAKKIRRRHDIAVLYYSGPQAPLNTGSWPFIGLSSHAAQSTIAVDNLSQLIQEKGPRFSLVLADCYEKVVTSRASIRTLLGKPLKKTHNKQTVKRFQKNWFRVQGSVLICSPSDGEIGYGMKLGNGRQYEGGRLTEAFLRALPLFNDWNKLSGLIQDSMVMSPIFPVQHLVYSSSISTCPHFIKKNNVFNQ